jgi:PadR family transcriptional regulator PadR
MPRRRHRWGGRRGRGGAWFLEPTLLLLLHYGPAHGYTLIEQLQEFGVEEVHPSVVYRALRDMEDREWVASTWDTEETQGPPRRVYQLTTTGDQVLSAYMQDLKRTHRELGNLIEAYERHIEQEDDHQERR